MLRQQRRRARRRSVMISDKVRPHHLERKAILYVRQSSAHQVLHNRESGALQYAMRDRLTALGWSEIEVIDDDLGRSAAGGVQRAGFERMVAEVCLGKVGAACAADTPRSLTSLTASILNSRLNLRLRMTHLRLHETPKLGVFGTGCSSPYVLRDRRTP